MVLCAALTFVTLREYGFSFWLAAPATLAIMVALGIVVERTVLRPLISALEETTLSEYGYDRYWRNARVHTMHHPVRWKYHHIGNHWLNGLNPPRHGAL